jgi:hypothetical protein
LRQGAGLPSDKNAELRAHMAGEQRAERQNSDGTLHGGEGP